MTNADKFKSIFGIYATELWAKSEEDFLEWLNSEDAVPVRHGKWLDLETLKRPWFRHHIFECSVCRNTLDMDGVNAGRGDANYCPNCGARMDKYATD